MKTQTGGPHISNPSHQISRPAAIHFLLWCARTAVHASQSARLHEMLEDGVCWEEVIDLARHHGLLLQITAHLESADDKAVPERIREKLRNSVRCRSRHDRQLPLEVAELHHALQEEGIPTLPYKGPVLAALAYRQPQNRQSGDLDLLVRQADVEQVRNLLIERGYRSPTNGASSATVSTMSLVHLEKRVLLDVHCQFAGSCFPMRIAFDELWERRQLVELHGEQINTLGVNDSVLAACVCGTRSHWSKLKWVCDVAELLQTKSSEIDWWWLLPYARNVGADRMLALGLLLASRLLEADLEPCIRAHVQYRPAVRSLVEQVEQWLFRNDRPAQGSAEDSIFRMRVCDSLRDRLHLMRQLRPAIKSQDRVRIKHLFGY